jgi:hypothetical protein
MIFNNGFTDLMAKSRIKRAMRLLGKKERGLAQKAIDFISAFKSEVPNSLNPEDQIEVILLPQTDGSVKGDLAINPQWVIAVDEKKLAYQIALMAHMLRIAKENGSAEDAQVMAEKECSILWRKLLS